MKTRNELIRDAAIEWAANNGHAGRSGYVMVVNGRPTGCLDLIPPPALVYNGTHIVSLCGGVMQVAIGGAAGEYATYWRTVYLDNELAALPTRAVNEPPWHPIQPRPVISLAKVIMWFAIGAAATELLSLIYQVIRL